MPRIGDPSTVRTEEQVLAELCRLRIVAVLREPSISALLHRANEVINLGIRAIEVTTSTPDWHRAVGELRQSDPALLIGVGTVRNAAEVNAAATSGADFLVSPGGSPQLVNAMVGTGLLAIPGCLTPSEMLAAVDAGAHVVKVFPASSIGLSGLRALRGPFAGLRVMATGGIEVGDIGAWLEAGAAIVGIGGGLSRLTHKDVRNLAKLQ